ncbi:MAG: hypothetical protein IJ318_02915 [Clostridia bacterium]|nr:hypothetical protein [Clostridia bacterium]
MTTNQKLWSKTVLSSYNYLKRLCDSIDKLIENTAVNSYYSFSYKNGENSIANISKKIINLSNRKIDYINLKVLTEKALKDMPKEQAKLLVLKFIHKIPIQTICNLSNISKRSAYRKLEQAIMAFMLVLSRYGYSAEKFELDYSGDPFVSSIYKLIKRSNFVLEEKAEVITNDSVFNKYINELMASAI